MSNLQIEVTGWDAEDGPAIKVYTRNEGRRNRRNRWAVHEHGKGAGNVLDAPAHGPFKDPRDRRKHLGYAFNRGHVYEADVLVDGEFKHTLTVDAKEKHVVLSGDAHPRMSVEEVRVARDDSSGDDEGAPETEREVGSEGEE